MKFTIQIYATDKGGVTTPIEQVDHGDALGARKEANRLLRKWKKRKANTVRISSADGKVLYGWTE